MDAVEKPAQRADRYRQADPPQAHAEVRDLQRDYLGLVTEQREKPRRRWPQSKAGNADCDAQVEPLPSKGGPFLRSTAAQGLGGKGADALGNAQGQGSQRIGDDAGGHGRSDLGGAHQGHHPGVDKAHHGGRGHRRDDR